jgi:hypothetical protein
MAGVPTLYSDQLQPSLQVAGIGAFILNSPVMLAAWFNAICAMTYEERSSMVDQHRKAVRGFAARCDYGLEAALGRTFQ